MKKKKVKGMERTYVFDPTVVALLALLAQSADDLATAHMLPPLLRQIEQHDAAVVRIPVDLLQHQPLPVDPLDLHHHAVRLVLPPLPVQLHNRFLDGALTRDKRLVAEIRTQVEEMHGHERVVVSGLGVLHHDVRRVRHNRIAILGGVVHGEAELVDGGLVEGKVGELGRVRCPPQRKVGGEDFLFVHPVGDAVEERGVAGGGDADCRG